MTIAPLLASQGRAGNIDSPMIAGALTSSSAKSSASAQPLTVSPALTARGNRYNADEDPFVVVPIQEAQGANGAQHGPGIGAPGDPMYTLATRGDHAVAFHLTQTATHQRDAEAAPALVGRSSTIGVMSFDEQQITHPENRAAVEPGAPAPTLTAQGGQRVDIIGGGLWPRRLTPREWERLQGFPDDWTLIETGPAKRKRAAPLAKDTARYKAIGNSMAIPVMRWIGERIELVDAIGDEP